MQIGIDSFSIHPLKLDAQGQLAWVSSHGFNGIQFGSITGLGRDRSEIAAVKARADGLGLYTHVSVGVCNPYAGGQNPVELHAALRQRIELAAGAGWHELHAALGGPEQRFDEKVPWPQQLEESTRVLEQLAPVLRDRRCRINFETHAEISTFELIRMIQRVGDDIAGICLDTANVVLYGEHPIEAARRAAPYTHMTHAKDCILWFVDQGLRRQTLPPGAGLIDWKELLRILFAAQPGLKISIEDHKWFFDAEIYNPRWQQINRDTPRDELLSLIRLAWNCHSQISTGQRTHPDAVEAIPYAQDMEQRLASGRQHLLRVAAELGV